jgi:hypothetical protein
MAALLGVGQLLAGSLLAQAATNDWALHPSNAASGRFRTRLPPEPPASLPPLPPTKSPVGFFRELLAMNTLERKQALADRSPENEKLILAKVREYASLDPDQRELRLQVTELRWYLLPLMTAPATNRAAQLATVPDRSRQFVADRLREWDKLPADVQKELLANEATLHYFTEIEGRTEDQRRKILEGLSPARRQKLQEGIDRWNGMPEEQRRKMLSRFKAFFDLTSNDKEKALRTLSAPERRQIEKTLRAFENLPADQRAKCIRSVEKFANLSLEDRQQFLKNAEHWKLLTPSQRQAWRELVNRLPPPLPPDWPPLPPSHHSLRPSPAVATKGN